MLDAALYCQHTTNPLQLRRLCRACREEEEMSHVLTGGEVEVELIRRENTADGNVYTFRPIYSASSGLELKVCYPRNIQGANYDHGGIGARFYMVVPRILD